jgi:hypothetical protein
MIHVILLLFMGVLLQHERVQSHVHPRNFSKNKCEEKLQGWGVGGPAIFQDLLRIDN